MICVCTRPFFSVLSSFSLCLLSFCFVCDFSAHATKKDEKRTIAVVHRTYLGTQGLDLRFDDSSCAWRERLSRPVKSHVILFIREPFAVIIVRQVIE